MRCFAAVSVFFIGLIYAQSSQPLTLNVDRQCGTDLSNLWLDVVIVVDNTTGMGLDGLMQIAAQVSTIFSQGTRIGSNYTDPRSTRVGLVTYNKEASIDADLSTFKSSDDLMNRIFEKLSNPSKSTNAYLGKGLQAAETVLTSGRANNVRSNYKQLIIVYASEYDDEGDNDPVPIANRLKSSGVNIATVAFDQDGETLINKLGEIATPGYAFSNTDLDVISELTNVMFQTNCYCNEIWNHYRADFQNEYSQKYGVCLFSSGLQSGWKPAKLACQNMIRKGYLATDFNQAKHQFMYQMAQNNPAMHAPIAYHIGLSFINGGLYWQQAANEPLLPKTSNFTSWNPGYPNFSATSNAVFSLQQGSSQVIGWESGSEFSVMLDYFCEVSSCDTDNYCNSM